MAAKQEDMDRLIDIAIECKEFANGTENESEIEVVVLDSDGSESHVDGGGEDGAAKTGEAGIGSSRISRKIPAFLQKLYDMLGNDVFNPVVSWSCTGTSFIIKNSHLFAADVLPTYFKHNNIQSFISQLNSYGFKKISWEQWEYKNEYFRKGEKNLLKNIRRRDHCSRRVQPSSNTKTSATTSSCSIKMENKLTILMKEHDQVKAQIMKLREKQHTLEEKFASLKNQSISNEEEQKRMMLVAQRILKKQRDSSNAGLPMLEECRETDQKRGKRKLEIGSATTQDNKGEMLLDEQEFARHHPNTLISLEDLVGDQSLDWVEYYKRAAGESK